MGVDEADDRVVGLDMPHVELLVLLEALLEIVARVAAAEDTRQHVSNADGHRLVGEVSDEPIDVGDGVGAVLLLLVLLAGVGDGSARERHQPACLDNVLANDVAAKVDARESLRQAHDSEKRACGGEAESLRVGHGLLAHVHVLIDDVRGHLVRHRGLELAHVRDESSHHLGLECLKIEIGVVPELVDVGDVPRELQVVRLARLIKDEPEQVKAREQRRGELDVLLGALGRVVPRVGRVGGCEHRRARVERCGDARLRNRDCLLLHDLVDGRSVSLLHLVKLIDAADAHVGQHKRATLENEVASDGVADHRRRQPDA
mmetsp:Transcript_57410/g.124764  ORF Transcript_57410/g.124764 Transcript_57410/m.124764 type:complete len:317 (+) Transcript_57410:459-1409(+)|eukprot:4309216-Pleurochrysis_carterae.AAC.10